MKRYYISLAAVLFFTAVSAALAAPTFQYAPTIYPIANNTYDLGSSTDKWRAVYTNDLTVSGTCTGCSGSSLPFYASTTIGDATPSGGLTISGSGTSTGTFYAPNIGINTPIVAANIRQAITGAAADTGVSISGISSGTAFSATSITTGIGLLSGNLTTGKAVSCTYNTGVSTGGCIQSIASSNITADYTGGGLFLNGSLTRNLAAAATRNDSGNINNSTITYSTSGALVSVHNASGTTTVWGRILSNASTGIGSAVGATAPVVEISNKTVATNGVTDSSGVLSVLQLATSSTGTVFSLNGAGSGNLATFSGSGNFGIGTTSPWRKLSVTGTVGFDGLTAGSGTSLCLSSSNEVVTCTVAGTGAAYPFQVTGNATSTLTQFNGGLTSFASTTIGDTTRGGGLTINGGATTTGIAYFANSVGISSTSPATALDVNGNQLNNGTLTITGNSASVLQINYPGTTTPFIRFDNSVANAGVGLLIQGQPLGTSAGVTIQPLSVTTNEDISLSSKGIGSVRLRVGSTDKIILGNSGSTYTGSTQMLFTPSTGNTAATVRFSVLNANDPALTASTEAPWVYFNGANTTRNHATGSYSLQRDFRITGSSHLFAAGGGTVTDVAALSVDNAIANNLATFTNSHAIYVPSNSVVTGSGAVTNSYGLTINAQTGATNNYVAQFLGGNVGFGTTSPWARISAEGISTLGNQAIAGFFTATSTTASVFPNASTTVLTVTNKLSVGGSSTTTIDSIGNIVVPAAASITDTALGTAAGTFVAADPTGKLIATSTPSGTGTVTTDVQTFSFAGTPTWTKPSFVTASSTTCVQIWGGGGGAGGGGTSGGDFGGGGGGAGYTTGCFLTSTLGSTETVTVATGGIGGVAGGPGTAGNSSSFGAWASAFGGGLGFGGNTGSTHGGGGGGGSTSVGANGTNTTGGAGGSTGSYGGAAAGANSTTGFTGGGGGNAGGNSGGSIYGGGGGSGVGQGSSSLYGGAGGSSSAGGSVGGGTSTFGGAGGAAVANSNGSDGVAPGGGGGAGAGNGHTGGVGAIGRVIVTTTK